MNKYKVVQIVCWLIVFLVFMGLAIWFLLGNNFRFLHVFGMENLHGPYEEEGRYQIEVADVDSININWTAGRVTVTPYDGNEIQLVEYAQRSLDKDEKLIYSVNGNTMAVSYSDKKWRWFDPMPSKKLEVFLPEELAADLNDFTLDCVSAAAEVTDLQAGSIQVKTVSGEGYLSELSADTGDFKSTSGTLELNSIHIPKITLKTVSGEIKTEGLDTEDVSAHSTSGSVRFSDVATKQLQFDTVSGDISFQGSYEEMQANSTSGSINVTDQAIPTGFHIKTVSGEVNLTMPSFEGFNLYKKTVSGSFDCEIPVTTQNESNAPYTIKTTSGGIDIRKLS